MSARATVAARLPDLLGMSEAEAAAWIGVSAGTFRQIAAEKKFSVRRPEGKLIYDREELDAYVGFVYVIQFGAFIKIGWSRDVGRRFNDIQAGLPDAAICIGVFRGSKKAESALHRRFSECRSRGEWFRDEGALAAWINAGYPDA